MPATLLMSWEPKNRRWWKMLKGERFTVSVRQLRDLFNNPSIPATKEGSYKWANQWWEHQTSHLARIEPSVHPHADHLASLNRNLDWSRRHAPDEVAPLASHLREVERMGEEDEPDYDPLDSRAIAENRRVAELFGVKVPDNLDPEIESHLFGLRQVRQDRLSRDENPEPVPVDRTIGHLIQRYLEGLFIRYGAGEISVGEYANARAGLYHYRDWVGADNPVDSITADTWDAYYLRLIGANAEPKSIESRRKHFRYARNFLTWLDDLDIHPAPKNLNRKQYRFNGGAKVVPTMSIDEVKNTLDAAKGQLKLHLLLMLNCGFTQQDISDLHPSEIDWEHGRIHRKRSKTSEHANVPIVDYMLWSETFALLQRYRTNDPNHVLMTESGKAWIRDSVDAIGKRSRTDAIQSNYRKLCVKGNHSLKMFRKASSNLIDSTSEHGRYAIHFLGQAPNDVAHKHYINANGNGFDAAVRWLGEHFGY
jgi:integrase